MIEFVRRRPLVLLLLMGALLVSVVVWAVLTVRHARLPGRVVMATGLEGGAYRVLGKRYRDILSRHGVRVELRPSRGDLDNIRLLRDERSDVSVAFVSGGLTTESESPGIVSLGAIGYYPLWIFCRGIHEPSRLANLRGKRISIGPEGSGTRSVSLELLRANQLEKSIVSSALAPAASAEALLAGEVDCACMLTTGDAPVVRKLLTDKRVELVSFARADAYVAQFRYLREVVVPEGAGSLAANLPSRDVTLIASTTSLLVREDLHPAIQFLLLQAADEIHSPGGILNRPGQFPAPEVVDVPLSSEAKPFYKSGGSFLQRHVPFWLWVFTPRLLLLLIPLAGILYPLSKAIPAVIDLIVNGRLDQIYGELRQVDRQMGEEKSREDLVADLERLEGRVRQMRVPAKYARALYTLRQHVTLVRERLGR
jgi:TRAP-type uncharacterized transport system substrate-binding protein